MNASLINPTNEAERRGGAPNVCHTAIALKPGGWSIWGQIHIARGSTWGLWVTTRCWMMILTQLQLIYQNLKGKTRVLLSRELTACYVPAYFSHLTLQQRVQQHAFIIVEATQQCRQGHRTNVSGATQICYTWGKQSVKAHRGKPIKTNKSRNTKRLLNNT